MPLAPMVVQFEQLISVEFAEVEHHRWLRSPGGDAINASVRSIPIGIRIGMGRPPVVPVGDIHRTVWPQRHVGRGEPVIVRDQQLTAMSGLHRGTMSLKIVPVDSVTEQISCNIPAPKNLGKGIALVHDPADRDVSSAKVAVHGVIEETVTVGIVQLTVFGK